MHISFQSVHRVRYTLRSTKKRNCVCNAYGTRYDVLQETYVLHVRYNRVQLIYNNSWYTFPKIRLHTMGLMHPPNLNTETCIQSLICSIITM